MSDKSFLHWPFLEPRHRELVGRLEAWAADNLSDIDHGDVDRTCRNLVTVLGRDGWLKFSAPGESEAERIDVRTLALIRETLARRSGLADFAFAMQGLGAGPVSLFGTAEQRKAGCQRPAPARPSPHSRCRSLPLALTLPTSPRSRVAMETASSSMAKRHGFRTAVLLTFTLFSRTGEAPGARGLSAFIVEADNPGLTVAERLDVIAPHPLARLRFEGCRVPGSSLIGDASDGFKIAMATLDDFVHLSELPRSALHVVR